jgi:hypothetical protein
MGNWIDVVFCLQAHRDVLVQFAKVAERPACADAALVWDGTRGFALTDEERDVVSTVVSPEKALSYSRDAPVDGAVVGVWRRGGRGVGRWPNADPVIPER